MFASRPFHNMMWSQHSYIQVSIFVTCLNFGGTGSACDSCIVFVMTWYLAFKTSCRTAKAVRPIVSGNSLLIALWFSLSWLERLNQQMVGESGVSTVALLCTVDGVRSTLKGGARFINSSEWSLITNTNVRCGRMTDRIAHFPQWQAKVPLPPPLHMPLALHVTRQETRVPYTCHNYIPYPSLMLKSNQIILNHVIRMSFMFNWVFI